MAFDRQPPDGGGHADGEDGRQRSGSHGAAGRRQRWTARASAAMPSDVGLAEADDPSSRGSRGLGSGRPELRRKTEPRQHWRQIDDWRGRDDAGR